MIPVRIINILFLAMFSPKHTRFPTENGAITGAFLSNVFSPNTKNRSGRKSLQECLLCLALYSELSISCLESFKDCKYGIVDSWIKKWGEK